MKNDGREERMAEGLPTRAHGPAPVGRAFGRGGGPRTPLRGWRGPQLALVAAAVAVGGALALLGATAAAAATWFAATLVVLVPTSLSTARKLLRGEVGVDLVAILAMVAALLLGEPLAAAIISLMLATGGALERYAVARARRELTALLDRAPRVAHRRRGQELADVDVEAVEAGDVLVVKAGEVVPADGVLTSASATVDTSALTGESRPVDLARGDRIGSGTTNAGAVLELRATAPAADSTYAGIVRLVARAEEDRAPFVRLADRYALGFVGVTVAVASLAWALSGDPIRALAVLVVATPCPLILAAPTAIAAGVSRAARHGILVKGGAALEALAGVRIVLLDKTGTVTASRPRVAAVESLGDLDADALVRLCAAADQVSVHPFGQALLTEARDRGLELPFPEDVDESLGAGLVARVDGRRVALGQLAFVAPDAVAEPAVRAVVRRTIVEGSSAVWLAVDDRLEGALILADPLRPEAPRAVASLRALGVRRIHMVTGDHPDVAELVGDAAGVDRVFAERTPEEKVAVVDAVRREGPTLMVGDGVNDAPALALADVGVAMGGHGATAASEAADVVLAADRLDSLVLAVRLAQRTRRIALQSVWVGMGLSFVAMGFAAAGHIPPVAGAVLQEGIDVLVILNALRALVGAGATAHRIPGGEALAARLAEAHRALRPRVEELASLAARLDALPPEEARHRLEHACEVLHEQVLPHEEAEQREAFPVVAHTAEGGDPTGPLVRTHQEIRRLVRLLDRLVGQLPLAGPGPADVHDLRRALYGLHAILTLHIAQEEELYSQLDRP